jgi:hypothetical protein
VQFVVVAVGSEADESQPAFRVTGCPPVHVIVVVEPVESLVPVATVDPEAFLNVRTSLPEASAVAASE